MEDKGDGFDVFAIPDFWKSSSWLDASLRDLQQDPFFALDVTSTYFVVEIDLQAIPFDF